MKRAHLLGSLFGLVLLSCSATPTSTTGRTFKVETSWIAGDGFCAEGPVIVVDGQQWYQPMLSEPRLPPGESIAGELFVTDEGPETGKFATYLDPGRAQFATGSTVATFTRVAPCY